MAHQRKFDEVANRPGTPPEAEEQGKSPRPRKGTLNFTFVILLRDPRKEFPLAILDVNKRSRNKNYRHHCKIHMVGANGIFAGQVHAKSSDIPWLGEGGKKGIGRHKQ